MAKMKASTPPRLVWRMSEVAPKGAWVEPAKPEESTLSTELPEVSSGSWVMSSFDLLHGTDITEDTEADTVPGDLFDELFSPRGKPPTSPEK